MSHDAGESDVCAHTCLGRDADDAREVSRSCNGRGGTEGPRGESCLQAFCKADKIISCALCILPRDYHEDMQCHLDGAHPGFASSSTALWQDHACLAQAAQEAKVPEQKQKG